MRDVMVERVECVSYETGFEQPADPIWRIVLDGYCADFPSEGAAQNFARAIGKVHAHRLEMLALLKRVVTVLDAEVFDELAADTLLKDSRTLVYRIEGPPYFECEDCYGTKQHGCYCAAHGATEPGST